MKAALTAKSLFSAHEHMRSSTHLIQSLHQSAGFTACLEVKEAENQAENLDVADI